VVMPVNMPVIMRAAVVFVAGGSAFVMAVLAIRALKRNIAEEADIESAATPRLENLPLHLYNTVIQQLKQQKHELQVQTLAEQRRARTTENFSQAVLSNLSSGVLVFGANGLVRQANPAAKRILGFNSPSGMSVADVFRRAAVSPGVGGSGVGSQLTDEIDAVLRGGSKSRSVEADYTTPGNKAVRIAVTISPVPALNGDLLGVACLMSDRSEFEDLRNQQQLQGEISGEMALELRTSLATISGYAQQLAQSRDAESAPQLAADIVSEAARLDRHIGGFLAAKRTAAGI
jgi:nitrogen-specific signal transduction histidine kinase